jgi:hypothetical protein
MLDAQTFKTVIENTPLVSIDLCLICNDQHGEFKWFDLSVVSNDEKLHPYICNYAIWLLNRKRNTHD